jgi:hypothetical protein
MGPLKMIKFHPIFFIAIFLGTVTVEANASCKCMRVGKTGGGDMASTSSCKVINLYDPENLLGKNKKIIKLDRPNKRCDIYYKTLEKSLTWVLLKEESKRIIYKVVRQ